jgi:hypothetical protein
MTKITTSTDLATIIQETVKNALSDYTPTDSVRETPEEKKARREGKKQAVERLSGKPVEELKRVYLKLERQAEESYKDSVKHAFLWGALDKIRDMLKKSGEGLPRKNQDPWAR